MRVQALQNIQIARVKRAAGEVFELDENTVDIDELVNRGDLALHPGEPFVPSAVPPADAPDARPAHTSPDIAPPGARPTGTSELREDSEPSPAKTSGSKRASKTASKRASEAASESETSTADVPAVSVTADSTIEESTSTAGVTRTHSTPTKRVSKTPRSTKK